MSYYKTKPFQEVLIEIVKGSNPAHLKARIAERESRGWILNSCVLPYGSGIAVQMIYKTGKTKGDEGMTKKWDWEQIRFTIWMYSIIGFGAAWFVFILVMWVMFYLGGVGDPDSLNSQGM